MATAFRLKSFPEILATAFARLRALPDGPDVDLNVGSPDRTYLEITALSDADQYVQIGKLLKFFSIDNCTGDDLDRRALDIGSLFFVPIRRKKAKASTVKVTVGDATLLAKGQFAADVAQSATSFSIGFGQGEAFASSGAAWLERGTARAEKIVYSRAGDVFSVVFPAGGLAFPHAEFGEVARIATQSTLASTVSIGGTSAGLAAGTGAAWPASGFAVFGRGGTSSERLAFTRSGDALSLGAPFAFAHGAGSFVVLSTAGSDRVFSAGQQVFCPPTESSKQVTFLLLDSGTLFDGDYTSDLVDALCVVVGSDTNVGSNTVTRFASSPFSGAVVTNPLPAAGGADQEKDDPFRTRIKHFVATLSRGTALAIETLVVGLFDEASNAIVDFAQVIEPVAPGLSQLYVTDGTASFAIGYQTFLGRDVAISDASLGDRRGQLHQFAPFLKLAQPLSQRTPRVFASLARGTSSSVGVDFLEDSTQNYPANAFAGMFLKAADDQFYQIVSNTPIRLVVSAGGATPAIGSYAVLDLASHPFLSSSSTSTASGQIVDGSLALSTNQYAGYYLLDAAANLYPISSNTATTFALATTATPAAGAYEVLFSALSLPLVPDVDFSFNETNGQLEMAVGLLQHDAVVASSDGSLPGVGAYTYSTGLAALVQRAVNGDPTDFSDFPGIKAAGTKVLVSAPTVISPSFIISVIPASGSSVALLGPAVKQVVQTYVNSLGMGDDVILSEIIRLVKGLPGVQDVIIAQPSSNVSVGDGQLARITSDDVSAI